MSLPRVDVAPATAPEGDSRGPYGFGRPAHSADPDASYGFTPTSTMAAPATPSSTVIAAEPELSMFVSGVLQAPTV